MEPDHVTVDVDALRAYLLDYCGTAMFSGFPAALLDVSDISAASPEELISRFAFLVRCFAFSFRGNEQASKESALSSEPDCWGVPKKR